MPFNGIMGWYLNGFEFWIRTRFSCDIRSRVGKLGLERGSSTSSDPRRTPTNSPRPRCCALSGQKLMATDLNDARAMMLTRFDKISTSTSPNRQGGVQLMMLSADEARLMTNHLRWGSIEVGNPIQMSASSDRPDSRRFQPWQILIGNEEFNRRC